MPSKNGRKPARTSAKGAATAGQGIAGLMYQLLETEMGGVQVYRTALQCAIHPELRGEWEQYLAETEQHVVIARDLVARVGLDPDAEVPARLVCRHLGEGLVKAMFEALAAGTQAEAQLTAAECVVKAETKDHANWELVGLLARRTEGELGDALRAAYERVEREEDHHLYHTTGWARELWLEAMGLDAVLPPPEEEQNVESAIAAAKAKKGRERQREN